MVTGMILYITVFSRTVGSIRIVKGLFWEYQQGLLKDALLNMLLFIPLGFFIGNKWGIVFGFLLSVWIELAQYFFALGYCELDDILHNTLGCLMGYMFHEIIRERLTSA